jgi:hypothetical protein
MISADEYYLQKSYAPYLDHFDISKKEYIFIEDVQRGTYPSGNFVSFDMASLGLTNKYSNWEESVLAIPLVMTLHCPNVAGNSLTGEVSNAFALSLKNGYHQLINYMKINISNNDIVNTQQLQNLKVHYDIVSSWSDSDVKTMGSTMNFHGIDSAESVEYFSAASASGLGICNNRITPKDLVNNWSPNGGYGFNYDDGNLSRRARMNTTSFDPSNGANTISTFTSENISKTTGKNYVSNSVSTASLVGATLPIIYYIIATIPLAQIHPLFKNMHMTKNTYVKLEFNLNTNFTTLVNFTAASATPTFASFVNSTSAPTCPFMISPLGVSAASTATNVTGLKPASTQVSFQVQLGISRSTVNGVAYPNTIMTSCRIYLPLYTLSPAQEEKYLTAIPEKRIVFEDYVYSNTNLSAIAANTSSYNANLFSQKRLRSILIIPQMASTTHGGALALGSPLLSPFSDNGCCPFARLSNFNVLINGAPWFPQNINYTWEQYTNEILKSKGTVFGNAMTGIKSGLLTQQDWETNHSYVFVDLSRWESLALDNASKTVGLTFTNASNVTCDYHVFLNYEREVTINTSTGQIVQKM